MLKDHAFILLQRCLPQHTLSRLVGYFTSSENTSIKNGLINKAIKRFNIDMSEAANPDPKSYKSFNDFFTRLLKDGIRPQPEDPNAISSPADGAISQIGPIREGRIFQAKGHEFSFYELVGGEGKDLARYKNGHFATIYLSPRDYHRVHMPADGQLTGYTHIPGKLFSVNTLTSEHIPNLFARNERVVFHFEGDQGPFIVIMVGAMLVASVETPIDGIITPPTRSEIQHHDYETPYPLKRGDELGRFRFGSTAIVLFPEGVVEPNDAFQAGSPIQLGNLLFHKKTPDSSND